MTFSEALENLKLGKAIAREAWQGKKWIGSHTIGGKRDIWMITLKKRSLDVVLFEKLSKEDILAKDWMVML